MLRFTATVKPARGGGHYVCVPDEVIAPAGLPHGARVKGTVNGVAYRVALMKRGGTFLLGITKATLAGAAAALGDEVDITLEPDRAPLVGDRVPKDLAAAIAKRAATKKAWAALAPSHKREHVRHVLDAKKPETRARRIAATLAALCDPPPAPTPAPRRRATS